MLTDSVSGLVGLQLAAAEQAMVRTLVAFEPPPGDPDPEVTAAMDRIGENLDFWLSHVGRPSFQGYTPDLATLRTGPTRIVVALGEASRPDQLTTRTTLALADQLGTTPATVPGDHEAVTSHPEAYTAMVKRVLGEG